MEKKLDLSKSVYDLVTEYPEVVDIMKELGFSEITNKVMLNSVGKIMTIPKGAKMKGVSMIDIVGAFMKAGFTLTGEMPNLSGDDTQGASMPPGGVAAVNSASTTATAPTAAATAVKAESVETSANTVASKTQENSENKTDDSVHDTVQDSERVEQLKSFLKRLGTGE